MWHASNKRKREILCILPSLDHCTPNWSKASHIGLNVLSRLDAASASSPRIPLPKKPSLAVTHPELARQWHPTKNGEKRPEDFTAGSTAKFWWLCPTPCSSCGKAHEWEARISHRAKAGNPTGCPFCCGQGICTCSSLATTKPDLMAHWDYAANESLDPEQIGVSSSRKVSWMCPQHGSWLAKVSKRAAGTGCPECGQVNRAKNRSRRGLLKDEHPELVAQLHPTKNEHLDLDKLTSGSRKKAVWVCHERQNTPPGCSHAHEWSASDRTGSAKREGTGCPFCFGLLVCLCNSLAVKAPEVAAQWHPTRNGDKRPDQHGAYSQKIVWWQHVSELTGQVHEWKASIAGRVASWNVNNRLSCGQCRREEHLKLITR